MIWISLVCLLALSSSAFGRSAYGSSYGGQTFPQVPNMLNTMRDQTVQRPFLPTLPVAPTQGYGQTQLPSNDFGMQQDTSVPPTGNYGSSYGSSQSIVPTLTRNFPIQNFGSMPRIPQFDATMQTLQQAPMMTPADTLCRGQMAETVIPIENGRKYVVCLDESKGVEQECPKGLIYSEMSRRCERKSSLMTNPCDSQPCLNGGQCFTTDTTYQCQCVSGFDGKQCELDARVCQTQQPCGQAPDTRCQSFRVGAALQYICIFQGGQAYGLTPQQAIPSPCQGIDGPQALTVTANGFIMCDGESMFVESCPGGTLWDDSNKACVWPDMQTSNARQLDQMQGYGYGSRRTMISRPPLSEQFPIPRLEQPRLLSSYNQVPNQISIPQPSFEQPRLFDSYGQTPVTVSKPVIERPRLMDSYSQNSYSQTPITISKSVIDRPRLMDSYSQNSYSQTPITISKPVIERPRLTQSYGTPTDITPPIPDQTRMVQSFDTSINVPPQVPDQSKFFSTFRSVPVQKPVFDQTRSFQSFGNQRQQDDVVSTPSSSNYY